MGSVIRPVFSNGERLTAQRLNGLVDYLRSSLRRALLAPLSPGVAAGLELSGDTARNGGTIAAVGNAANAAQGTPLEELRAVASPPSATISVSPGVAIDGEARILVSPQTLRFTYPDILAQIPDLAGGDTVLVSLGAAGNDVGTGPGDCAPLIGRSVDEGVQLFFSRIDGRRQLGTLLGSVTSSPSVVPWAELIDQPGTPQQYAVPLGSVFYEQAGGLLLPSMLQRAGVMPTLGAVRNSFGDISVVLTRVRDILPVLAVEVLSVFEAEARFRTYAGGPLVQAAVLATDLLSAPAARPTSTAPTVAGVAGGGWDPTNSLPSIGPGAGGVVAVSLQYDTKVGATPFQSSGGFPNVPHSGFPIALSPTPAGNQPLAAPLVPQAVVVGLAAAPSYPDPNDTTGATQLVPVATAGIVQAYVLGASTLGVGAPLTPATGPTMGPQVVWPLVSPANSSSPIVARLAAPVSSSGASTGPQPAWVWVMQPSQTPPTTQVIP
jgi:hypothetical protein